MKESAEQTKLHARHSLRVTRREIMLSGVTTLIGLSLRGNVFAGTFTNLLNQNATLPGVTTLSGAKKPVFVPAAGSMDPVAHSLAESLFWLDQETEHTKFFLMHMPSPDLDTQRAQVQQFQTNFTNQLQKVQSAQVDRSNFASFNQSTIELVRRFFDVKQTLRKAQEQGQLKSLAWPAFFDHTALEGERFAKRLESFSRGKVEMDRSEVVNFWTRIMADHADFIAHLLDPQEKALIEKAMKTSRAWREVRDRKAADSALDGFIAFKKTAQAGVEAGKIKSIIHPLLADHVLREALKFSDELKRVS